jgi:DNA-binding GntR family transcriptional regulator
VTLRLQSQPEWQSLSDRAYKMLEEMIVTLKLPPGRIITEKELASRLGIGRTPLREAVQRLTFQHLVTTLPRRGLVVNEMNLTDHLGVLETRKALDRILAAAAARRATPDERERLRKLSTLMAEAARGDDLAEFMSLDQQLDQLLEEASHHTAAANAIAPLHIHCRRFWYLYRHQGDLVKAADCHASLISAIVGGDERQAAASSDRLLHYLEDFTRKALDLYLTRGVAEKTL